MTFHSGVASARNPAPDDTRIGAPGAGTQSDLICRPWSVGQGSGSVIAQDRRYSVCDVAVDEADVC